MTDDPPRDPDGIGYAMWIFRLKRGDRFEEIHVPRHGRRGEYADMRRRARLLADETGGAVAWADGTTSAHTNSNTWHAHYAANMWMVAWPRNADPGTDRLFTNWEVTECPNLDIHHRPAARHASNSDGGRL